MKKDIVLKGVSISSGVAIGTPFFLFPRDVKNEGSKNGDVDEEIKRYRGAVKKSEKDLQHLQKKFAKEGLSVVVTILESHLEILHDPVMSEMVENKIRASNNTESAFNQAIKDYKSSFSNDFFKERIKDVKDVSFRVLKHLQPVRNEKLKISKNSAILIANDLVPSDAFEAKLSNILAFVTRKGGYSSHAGIIARAKGIPYVANIDIDLLKGEKIENLIIDGIGGMVIANPSKKRLEKYKNLQKKLVTYQKEISEKAFLDAVTKDGLKIDVFSNIDSIEDLDMAFSYGFSGVGLFRTEYICLKEKKFPSFEHQFKIYSKIAKRLKGKPFVIRLFDIGGDKNYFFSFEEKEKFQTESVNFEANPVLGIRAIRFLMKNKKILEDQLRAILEASKDVGASILIPFVSDIYEVKYIKNVIEEIKQKIGYKRDVKIGIMVEVPSTALMIDSFLQEVDFCSIGTNDLMQFLLAADRSNPGIGYFFDNIHPSFLKLLEIVRSSCEKHGKPFSICGELASDPRFSEILIGMGVRKISVSSRHIPIIKHTIRNLEYKKAKEKAKKAMGISNTKELDEFL